MASGLRKRSQTHAESDLRPTGRPAPRPVTGSDGTVTWRLADGTLHRTDGPAVQQPHGQREWWLYGKRHREDGPAVIGLDMEWWINGRRHCDDGPAVVRFSGRKEWWLRGRLHREDGPAVVHKDGWTGEWWINGEPQWPPKDRRLRPVIGSRSLRRRGFESFGSVVPNDH